MRFIHSAAIIGLSAFLLFLVQPLVSKLIFPTFGGSASIWLTCVVFFQFFLLAGYSSTHLILEKVGTKKHAVYQIVMILVSLVVLPLELHYGFFQSLPIGPTGRIFLALTATLGLPYFALSTTSPTLQHWISTQHLGEKNPYILYAISNGGSLLGLLLYPLWMETNFTLSQQTWGWTVVYGSYVALIGLYLLLYYRELGSEKTATVSEDVEEVHVPEPTSREKWQWILLSAIPSAALLEVTHHLSSDISNFPLIWVIPLALYLLSFVVCFSIPAISRPSEFRNLWGFLALLVLAISYRGEIHLITVVQISVASLGFFLLATYFHGDLERQKPPARHLTSFYLYLSLGGCLGGTFVGVIAPLLFQSRFEFFLISLLSLHYLLKAQLVNRPKKIREMMATILIGLAVFIYINQETRWGVVKDYRNRSFYGVYRIAEKKREPNRPLRARLLISGNTIHGGEGWDWQDNHVLITYYHEHTGIYQVLNNMKFSRMAVIGLGTGVAARFATSSDQHIDFYEIDPLVVDIAKNQFSHLRDSPAQIRHIIGDGRLEIAKEKAGTYDVIILDAFSSGAIPAHLLTREAVAEYLRVLTPNGILLFHISNRHVRLAPVLNGLAERLDLHVMFHISEKYEKYYRMVANWAVLTRDKAFLEKTRKRFEGWHHTGGPKVYWTDEFNSLWPLLKWNK